MPKPLPLWTGRHTLRRRAIQMALLAVFALLPLFDLLRFDFPSGRLLLFRQSVGLDEWALLWLFLMFAMWLIGAASLVLGRVYCAYACPQTVFSELAHDLDALGDRLARRFPSAGRKRVSRAFALSATFALSLITTVLLMAYFATLPDVVSRVLKLDFGPWVGAVGAVTTALAFANLVLVRERFCHSACPYGLLQGVIEDGRSLHVRLDESGGECIDCGVCARVCPMRIDIREGSFQIECTRCGSCIDSCDAVLGRLEPARPGVLFFDLGQISSGGWDLKRGLVAFATLGFGVALAAGVWLREPISLHLAPMYAAEAGDQATAETRFLLRAANRTQHEVTLGLEAEGLPAETEVTGLDDPVLPPGAERRYTLVVRVPRGRVQAGVTPFSWVVEAGARARRFPASFFARAHKES